MGSEASCRFIDFALQINDVGYYNLRFRYIEPLFEACSMFSKLRKEFGGKKKYQVTDVPIKWKGTIAAYGTYSDYLLYTEQWIDQCAS